MFLKILIIRQVASQNTLFIYGTGRKHSFFYFPFLILYMLTIIYQLTFMLDPSSLADIILTKFAKPSLFIKRLLICEQPIQMLKIIICY